MKIVNTSQAYRDAAKIMANPKKDCAGCCEAINRAAGWHGELQRKFRALFYRPRRCYWFGPKGGDVSQRYLDEHYHQDAAQTYRDQRVNALLLAAEHYEGDVTQW